MQLNKKKQLFKFSVQKSCAIKKKKHLKEINNLTNLFSNAKVWWYVWILKSVKSEMKWNDKTYKFPIHMYGVKNLC